MGNKIPLYGNTCTLTWLELRPKHINFKTEMTYSLTRVIRKVQLTKLICVVANKSTKPLIFCPFNSVVNLWLVVQYWFKVLNGRIVTCLFCKLSLIRSNTWIMTINLYFSRYLPGIFTSIKVYSKNGITIVTCARYTLQCFVCTQICHGISWLNMTKYTKYVELSCVLHVFCDNEISYFLPLVFVILNGNVFDVTGHGKFFLLLTNIIQQFKDFFLLRCCLYYL
jgi:hypothetical protein